MRRLIFSFYATENFEENIANRFHFKCLERYSGVFDEVIICIISDDLNKKDIIRKAKKRFLDIFDCKIIFKTYSNTAYGESVVFENEIVKQLKTLGGITFFAHNKGVSNIENKICDKNSVLRWIFGMYYLNLEDVDDVETKLMHSLNGLFYGAYLTLFDKIQNKSHMWYAGTFYWLNAPKIYRYCETENVDIPVLSDRFYDELFPGEICEWNKGYNLCSKYSRIIYNKNLYINSYQSTIFLLEDDTHKFNEAFKSVKKDVFPYDYTILTYNFGDYDILHEIINKQNNVEYVCVTDNRNLTSNTWDIIYEESLNKLTPMEKVYHVRYNCFDYCSTNLCVKVDSSIEIKDSIDELIHAFEIQDKRLAFMVHPRSETFDIEYDTWISERNLDVKEKDLMTKYASELGLETDFKGMYEVGFIVVKKDYDTIRLNSRMIEGIKWFKENGINIRVDQALFSVVLNSEFKYLNVLPLSHSIIQSDKVRWYVHGSNKYWCTIPVNSDEGYCFNNMVKLYNW